MAERTDRRATEDDFAKYSFVKRNIPCGRYKGWKGGIYRVKSVAISSETLEPIVVYCEVLPNGCDDNIEWTRPAEEWYDSMPNGARRYTYMDSNSNFR